MRNVRNSDECADVRGMAAVARHRHASIMRHLHPPHRHTLVGTTLLLLTCLVGACADASLCGPPRATVTRIIDGDTIELDSGETVRYLLVNAPETTSGKNECYGAKAVSFNSDLVLGKTVTLRYDSSACTDRFARLLAYVTVDGVDVNAALVERGYACVLHIPPGGDARAAEFTELAAAAKAAQRGLWGECKPAPCQ